MKTCQCVILSPQPLRQQPHRIRRGVNRRDLPSQLLEAEPCHGAAQRAVVLVVLQQEVLRLGEFTTVMARNTSYKY